MNLKSLLIAFFVLLIIALSVYFLWPKPGVPRVPEIPGCDVVIEKLPFNLSMSNKVICLGEDFELNLTDRRAIAILISGSKNLTLDCLNHRVINRGKADTGIWINNSSDILIRNCRILNFPSPFQIDELPQFEFQETKRAPSQHITIENSEFSREFMGEARSWGANELLIFNSSFKNSSLIIYGGRGHRIEGNFFYYCQVGIKANDVIFSRNVIEDGLFILFEGKNVTLKQNNLDLRLLHLFKITNLTMLNNDIYLESSIFKSKFLERIFEVEIALFDKENRIESNKVDGKYFSIFGTKYKECPTEDFDFSNYSVVGLIGCSNLQIENISLIAFFGSNLSRVEIKEVNISGSAILRNSKNIVIRDGIFGSLWISEAENFTISSNKISRFGFSGNKSMIRDNLIIESELGHTSIRGDENELCNNSFNHTYLTLKGRKNKFDDSIVNCSRSLSIIGELNRFKGNLLNCPDISISGSSNSFSENIFKGECSGLSHNNFTNNYWSNQNSTGFSDICNDLNEDGICDQPFTVNGEIIDPTPLSKYYFLTTPKS